MTSGHAMATAVIPPARHHGIAAGEHAPSSVHKPGGYTGAVADSTERTAAWERQREFLRQQQRQQQGQRQQHFQQSHAVGQVHTQQQSGSAVPAMPDEHPGARHQSSAQHGTRRTRLDGFRGVVVDPSTTQPETASSSSRGPVRVQVEVEPSRSIVEQPLKLADLRLASEKQGLAECSSTGPHSRVTTIRQDAQQELGCHSRIPAQVRECQRKYDDQSSVANQHRQAFIEQCNRGAAEPDARPPSPPRPSDTPEGQQRKLQKAAAERPTASPPTVPNPSGTSLGGCSSLPPFEWPAVALEKSDSNNMDVGLTAPLLESPHAVDASGPACHDRGARSQKQGRSLGDDAGLAPNALHRTDQVRAAEFDAYVSRLASDLSKGDARLRLQIARFMESLRLVPDLTRAVRSNLPLAEVKRPKDDTVECTATEIIVRRQSGIYYVTISTATSVLAPEKLESGSSIEVFPAEDTQGRRDAPGTAQAPHEPEDSVLDRQRLQLPSSESAVPVEQGFPFIPVVDRVLAASGGAETDTSQSGAAVSIPDPLGSRCSFNAAGPVNAIRVRIGSVDFNTAGGSAGLFETVSFRVLLQQGGDRPAALKVGCLNWPRWIENGPATKPVQLKYGRVVSESGVYKTRFTCEYDEDIDLPWETNQVSNGKGSDVQSAGAAAHLSADVWLERRTAIEKLDSMLSMIGLGNDFAEYERVWLGRSVFSLPPVGVESMVYPWPVEVDGARCEGPVPKSITVGIEWVSQSPDAD